MDCDPGGNRRRVLSGTRVHSQQERNFSLYGTIRQVMVQWKHLSPEEATWELESNMQEEYPGLFQEADMDE